VQLAHIQRSGHIWREVWMATNSQAPGELELVRAFLNTHDVEEGIDEIATPSQLADWPTAAEVARAGAAREALRSLLLSNNGEPLDPAAVETLNDLAADTRLLVRFEPDGGSVLTPQSRGVDEALGVLLGIVFRSMADGTWGRLKACRDDTCQWAFYDRSKNRSATWCSMRVCGNRAKARSYRRRHSG
jgi:predicted RNA-binding Zn ribbon-like protein